MISAHSSMGNPAMPVPTAGNAMDFSPRSAAMRNACAVACRSDSGVVAPPSCMLAACITYFALRLPPLVIAAYPTGMLPISLQFALNRVAAFAANRPGHAAAENQIVVRGVDNRVRLHLRQVALLDHDFRCRGFRALLAHLVVTINPAKFPGANLGPSHA